MNNSSMLNHLGFLAVILVPTVAAIILIAFEFGPY